MSTIIHSPAVRDRALHLMSAGLSAMAASRVLGVSGTAVCRWWAQAGGMTLTMGASGGISAVYVAADGPGGAGHRLSVQERMTIQGGLQEHLSWAAIGALIGRDKSVVWREVRRNSGADGQYQAAIATALANQRSRRPKEFKLVANPLLCARIEEWMDVGWSPRLISQVLARDFADDDQMQVSHETIYQCLYVQTRGELRKDLSQQLSLKRSARLPRKSGRAQERRGKFTDALKISDRPAEADDRAVPGHWEGDLIVGTYGKSAIGTLVERSTRFTLLLHLPERHTADAVATAMIAAMKDLPEHLRRTLTWDRGSEMAGYEQIRMALGTPVYFCDPHSPWQRGTNENTNRLLRHWFAKGTDLSQYTAADLRRVQDHLNRRPRPTLDLDTPAQRMNKLIQPTAA
jgi:IS30 family transposase